MHVFAATIGASRKIQRLVDGGRAEGKFATRKGRPALDPPRRVVISMRDSSSRECSQYARFLPSRSIAVRRPRVSFVLTRPQTRARVEADPYSRDEDPV